MEEKINKVKKRIKGDRIFISIILFVMICIATYTTYEIVKFSFMSSESFAVKVVDKGSLKGLYCLLIDGQNWDTVDYNEYLASVDENGNINIKMCVIIQEIGTLIKTIIMAIIFCFAYLILVNIYEPFSPKNIYRLRIIAVLTMLLALLPESVMIIVKLVVFYNVNISISQINFFVLMTGVLLGVISEIFNYGHELQEEIEQIA